MSYKTILVHVDQSPQAPERIRLAARIAIAQDAHLIGAALTNLSPLVFAGSGIDAAMPPIVVPFDLLREEAGHALDAFEELVRAQGVLSYERRLLEEEAGLGISMQARYCDLVVVGQHDANIRKPALRGDFPDYVLLNSARPVLLVPAGCQGEPFGRQILVAWNGSVQATRAIASALGMLQRASAVTLAVLNPRDDGDLHGPSPGADMALFLARHDVKVDVRVQEGGEEAGAALLSIAADVGADLLVMGAYGHSRFREILLGGATRSMLRNATVPVWMVH